MAHTISTAALFTLLCTLLATHSTAATRILLQNSTAPAVEPIVNGGTFSTVPPGGFTTHLTFGANKRSANQTPGLKAANMSEVATSLKPCTMLQTHTHPFATELLTVVRGNMTACAYLNDRLDCASLGPGGAFAFPQNHVFTFFNPTCHEAESLSVLNANVPNDVPLYDSAKVPGLISGQPSISDFKTLIATQKPTNFYPASFQFVPLLGDCGCGSDGNG